MTQQPETGPAHDGAATARVPTITAPATAARLSARRTRDGFGLFCVSSTFRTSSGARIAPRDEHSDGAINAPTPVAEGRYAVR